jgi:hypothetical protein
MRTCTLYYGMCSKRHAYWETDTMYLDGIKSIFNMYRRRGGTKIEFYSETDIMHVAHSFYEAR